jgi:diaminopimelate epimerase
MKLTFSKYQGTGNDFIMIDNRDEIFPKNKVQLIEKLCNRRFGIGADGLILLENDPKSDFKMVYYNSDGNQSSMCGNGGRCLVAFAKKLGIIRDETTFIATDGLHFAKINDKNYVSLQMIDVEQVKTTSDYSFLDTGSPHHVEMVDNLKELDVKTKGATIRYSELYGNAGSNVNFVKQIDAESFAIRTYERGVEDETLSCGTGATAAAIAMYTSEKTNQTEVNIDVEGGKLKISFTEDNGKFTDVFLNGPAEFVFEGTVTI